MTDNRIPATIVTGFLGAGKTTLLNQIIRKHPDKRFAIIENEIGEIGIDGGLLVNAGENIFELSNGCICCSLNSDFNEVIGQLLERSESFDYLLVETTGIADPGAVVESFLSSEFIQSRFRVDAVVCLADAVNLEDCIRSEAEARKQLALADIVLLNKTESVRAEYLQELQQQVADVNASAQCHCVSYADISEINILNTFSYSGKGIEKTTLSFRNVAMARSVHEIQSVGISIPGSFNPDKFYIWMENYLFFNGKDAFRIKGILSLEGMDRRLILQSVSSSYVVEEGEDWGDEQRFCKLVFIGRGLVREELEWALHRLA